MDGFDIRAWSVDPSSWRRIRDAEAAGSPFLVLRDGDEQLLIVTLGASSPIAIGRSSTSDLTLDWDERISRTHAELARVGHQWAIEDDGLSRNGTFVNEVRISSKRMLLDGDVLRIGQTVMVYRSPEEPVAGSTIPESILAAPPPLSPGHKRVLAALCEPCLAPGGPHPPASNEEIAGHLHLTVDAVKAQLRLLYRRFGVADLPQIQKRSALVRIVVMAGLLRS